MCRDLFDDETIRSALDGNIIAAPMQAPLSERQLLAIALKLGARRVRGWSRSDTKLALRTQPSVPKPVVIDFMDRIKAEGDPLGDTFSQLRSPQHRRHLGATYTPSPIVNAMVAWAEKTHGDIGRIVDPGAGSGRFLVAAGRRLPNARLVGVEIDPLAAILARGHLAAAGMSSRGLVVLGDYRSVSLPKHSARARTLFIGNPPYVRHHGISASWKKWLSDTANKYGLEASQLAGLHVHFFLATLSHARPGDVGCFVTSGEWLDVNYGRLVRNLFLGPLGGLGLTVLEPTVQAFPDAATTAIITCFEVGSVQPTVKLRRVRSVEKLRTLHEKGRVLDRENVGGTARWSLLTRNHQRPPEGFVELGEICRVHRGQVTGANDVWIAGRHSANLPARVLFPSITKARELFDAADQAIVDSTRLRRVIDLPVELDRLCSDDRREVEAFLRIARQMGADRGYIARNRKAWWAVGLREPAPILATYMARRPPAFVRNVVGVRHINIAHGFYPRESLSVFVLNRLAAFLNTNVGTGAGRTYAGGLTKFEPKEMERLVVPDPTILSSEIELSLRQASK